MVLPELPFSIKGEAEIGPGSFRPILSKPSAIYIAWLLFGVSGLAWGYLFLRGLTLPPSLWITSMIVLLVALAITFSYWLERRTFIVLEEGGIRYESPLRKVTLQWGDIHELWCASIRGGWRFMISSSEATFRFESLSVVQSGSGREVRSGFNEGKRIVQLVQQRADLRYLDRQDRIWVYRKQDRTESDREGVLR